jgi:amidohydrolase
MSIDDTLRADAQTLAPELVELRRRLHQHPEVGLRLPQTQRLVLDALEGLDLEVSQGTSTTSVTAVLRGAPGGPTVLLRGDMDALPLSEDTGLEFSSQEPGAMHACGHDLHTAMLVGAARLLSAHRDELAGDVVFMFQPGEEGYDGAGLMIEEGVLEASGRRADSAYGMHVMAAIGKGVFTTRPGTFMSASAALSVTVKGAGGHGSAPHLAKDPITVAAQILCGIQTMVTRRFNVFDPVVVTPGKFTAGTARNIIPDSASFEATVRAFSLDAQERVETELLRVCHAIGQAYDVEVEATFRREYPPTINHDDHAAFVSSVVGSTFGDERFELMKNPQPGSEDFSRVIAAVPGSYLMVGARATEDDGPVPDNHSPRVRFDESVLPDGVLLHAQLAIQALRRDAAEPPAES